MFNWGTAGAALALLLASIFAASALAGWLQRARAARIKAKCAALGRSDAGRSSGSSASSAAPTSPHPPVPVTILTGFLGSGKTSTLNHILTQPGGRKICVIENEAGAISVDHSLLATVTAPVSLGGSSAPAGTQEAAAATVGPDGKARLAPGGVFVLKNGCMCCSAGGPGDELERTLDVLLQLAASGSAPFDHVVVETSGLVDPGPIIETFLRPDVSTRFSINCVVAVVDACHVGHHLDGRGFLSRELEAGRQVAYADVILLNKVDVASQEQQDTAVAAVTAVNPAARIIPTVRGAVPDVASTLLDAASYSIHHTMQLGLSKAAGVGAAKGKREGKHAPAVEAITLALPQLTTHAIPFERIAAWLREIVAAGGDDLYRVKGLVWVVTQGAEVDEEEEGEAAAGGEAEGKKEKEEEGAKMRRRRGGVGTGSTSSRARSSGPALRASAVPSLRVPAAQPRLLVIQGVHAELQAAYAEGVTPASVVTSSGGSSGGTEEEDAAVCGEGCNAHAHHGHHGHGHGEAKAAKKQHAPVSSTAVTPTPALELGLVVIGRRFDAAALLASFKAVCLSRAVPL